MDQAAQPAGDVFSGLSTEDRHMIVSLPYRVGLYVSFADVTGGWEAQEQELQSLTNILRQFSEDYYKSEFSQKVLMETLRERARWPAWSQHIDQVPAEAEKVVAFLSPQFSEKQFNAFKEILIDIALAVAKAFREHGPEQPVEKPSPGAGVRDILSRLVGARPENDVLGHRNVSISERRAVQTLAKALQYTKL